MVVNSQSRYDHFRRDQRLSARHRRDHRSTSCRVRGGGFWRAEREMGRNTEGPDHDYSLTGAGSGHADVYRCVGCGSFPPGGAFARRRSGAATGARPWGSGAVADRGCAAVGRWYACGSQFAGTSTDAEGELRPVCDGAEGARANRSR